MFDFLKKKFSGAVGKVSDKFSDEESLPGDETGTGKKMLPVEGETVEKASGKEQNGSSLSAEDISSTDDSGFKIAEEEKTSRFAIFRRKSTHKEEVSGTDKEETVDKIVPEDIDETRTGPGSDKVKTKDTSLESEPGLFGFATHKTISQGDLEDVLFELELSLLEGDVALEVAEKIIKSVENDLVGRKIKRRSDVALHTQDALKKAISEILMVKGPNVMALAQEARKAGEPLKLMFVGINGTGKTTTISKLADYFVSKGFTPVLAASDTFRAGAIEQITHHAENLKIKIIKHQKGADPAAVAYDAVEHARAQKKELVFIDTAGRMQTNTNLMDEMKKIQRVVKPDLVIFVGDALTGNDVVEQATKFNDAVGLDGIILTKADADAKGGAALSIGYVVQKPILFLGVGQGYKDIIEFKPDWMVEQIFGSDA
ncbi:MAG: signal recognition particle-docking protein FtsY [Euryarchaeota archaeon]|nr:signal recognition particle-docking protein FtsY [Euryarchaeota archaeon]HNS25661.1 signal recognition particle-docking protein FtsY [Methanobacteriaceae archaeon]